MNLFTRACDLCGLDPFVCDCAACSSCQARGVSLVEGLCRGCRLEEFTDYELAMRAMLDPSWPQCAVCREWLALGTCGWICLHCDEARPFSTESIHVWDRRLRELFPERCVQTTLSRKESLCQPSSAG